MTIQSIPVRPATHDAIKCPAWREAILDEFDNHHKYDTFKLVKRPFNTPLIPLAWVLTPKYNINHTINKFKARLVAAGNFEPLHEEEQNTAPTTDSPVVKILLSIALQHGWSIKQADVTAAYLHAPLTHKVYARLPTHYQLYCPGANPDTDCIQLKQILFRFRISGRNWFDHFSRILQSIQFQPLYSYDTIFYKRTIQGIIFCLIYVDDCMFTATLDSLIHETIADLQKAGIDIKLLGNLAHFLGEQHTRTGNHSMTLHRPPSSIPQQHESTTKSPTPSYQYYLDEGPIKKCKTI